MANVNERLGKHVCPACWARLPTLQRLFGGFSGILCLLPGFQDHKPQLGATEPFVSHLGPHRLSHSEKISARPEPAQGPSY